MALLRGLIGLVLVVVGAIGGGLFVEWRMQPKEATIPHRLEATIYLPTQGSMDRPVSQQWDEAVAELAKEFGGATLGPTYEGSWRNAQGILQREPVRLVIISFEPQKLERFRELARAAGRKLGQEAIYIRYERPAIDLLVVGQ